MGPKSMKMLVKLDVIQWEDKIEPTKVLYVRHLISLFIPYSVNIYIEGKILSNSK